MAGRRNWRAAARCRTTDAEGLFVKGARQREAREFCRTCPVRTECLAHALDQRIEFGVWGGTTERERRALLRSRPHVTSWLAVLLAAREAHLARSGRRRGAAAGGRAVGGGADPGCAVDDAAADARSA
jgi:WhiB family transcriptional regulator, redox-sensing transcriptional regulator